LVLEWLLETVTCPLFSDDRGRSRRRLRRKTILIQIHVEVACSTVGYHDSIVKGGSNAHDARNEVSGSCRHVFATVARFSPPPAVSPSSFQRGYVDASRIQSEAATRKPFGNNLRFQTAIVGTALIIPPFGCGFRFTSTCASKRPQDAGPFLGSLMRQVRLSG